MFLLKFSNGPCEKRPLFQLSEGSQGRRPSPVLLQTVTRETQFSVEQSNIKIKPFFQASKLFLLVPLNSAACLYRPSSLQTGQRRKPEFYWFL